MNNPTSHSIEPAAGERPVWMRAIVLAATWLLVLQPTVSSAQLSQSPMFTVTSAPPNVMLMFDDSASMNRLDLNPPPAYDNPFTSGGGASYPPLAKVNTAAYFGISGIGYYCGGAPHTYCDGRWQFSRAELLTRSAAFNPLSYNPAIEYKPWNNNGARFPNASIGGTGLVATGARTEWDPRRLPPSMAPGYPAVASFLTAPNQGVIQAGGELRSWGAPAAGSVTYAGLPEGGAPSYIIVTGGSASGADLFTNNITFDSPDCTPDPTTYYWFWYCPAGTGGSTSPALDTCDAPFNGMPSTSGRCCNLQQGPAIPTTGVTAYTYGYFSNVPGVDPPPSMTPPTDADSYPTCLSVVPTGGTQPYSGPPCSADVDPPAYLRACGPSDPPGAEECFTDPPIIPGTCTTYYNHQWRCEYTHTIYNYNYTCPVGTDTAQVCGGAANPATCSGAGGTPTLTGNARYVSGNWTPARYLVYDGPAARTSADIREMDNYRMIMVDRSFGWNGTTQVPSGTGLANAVGKYYVVDAVTGLPAPAGSRTDCPVGQVDAFANWCTFAQEAQNYANWYTYYRSRLFAAVGVMSEVASGLRGPEQFMRMGYGRINYFPDMRNSWNVASLTDRNPSTLPAIDGVGTVGGVERGVRPFTVYDPPLSAIPNPARQNVFDWLFTINGLGPTPNREALHASGLYFTRNDSKGPWGAFPGIGSEPVAEHLWCRRNYTLLATDGEWTRLASSQPRLESGALAGTLTPLGGPGSVSESMRLNGPTITGVDRDTGNPLAPYTYVTTSELAIWGGSGNQKETLTDVLHYYWTHDLRPDLQNSLKTTARNRAFWQHMSAFIVGYGVVASVDAPARVPALRTDFDTQTLISWPQVGLEDCRQLDDNDDDTAVTGGTCTHVPNVSPGSGNRINDTLRGGLTSGGDFFSATSPAALRSSLEAVFAAIGSDNASGTSPGLSSTTVGAGNLIIQSGFFTNTWDGYVRAYDQKLLLAYLSCTVAPCTAPTTLWSINFDAPAARPIFTSTAINSPAPFTWVGGISTTQQTAIGSSDVLDYLRGDQTKEIRFAGGQYRNRINSILGDVVASTPVYSKATDHGYNRTPAASRVVPFTNTAIQGSTKYATYLNTKRTTRAPIAMFGANDGMFHVLDARVGVPGSSGKEIFAYVPRSLYFSLNQLASPAYAHRFYVDGPVIESDIFDGTDWKTIAIGTTGAGAAGIFAIDVTDPVDTSTGVTNMNASNLKWDIVPSDTTNPAVVQSDLGNVLQPGIIGSVKDLALPKSGRWVYMVGNGYDSVSQEATLFVFDAFDGSLVKALKTNVGPLANPFGPTGPNGLGGITPVYDGNRNIIAVYGGDKLGNMWKFDFSSGYINDPDGVGPLKGAEIFNKVSGSPAPLFTAHDGVPPTVGAPQPTTAAPRITPHGISGVHVGFGTGKLFEPGDQISLQEQAVYVVWDKGQIPSVSKASLQRIRLQDVTFSGEKFRQLNAADLAAYDWTQQGFYIPLNAGGAADGERILSPGILDAGVLTFTSFAQQSAGTDLCTPGGTSHVYRFNLIGGLAEAGFLGVTGPVVGKRIQPGLVSAAPPIYDPIAVSGPTVDKMDAADVKNMLANPKYKQQSGRAVQQGATGTCAHVGLKVDGTVARIPTACAGLVPLRTWRPVR